MSFNEESQFSKFAKGAQKRYSSSQRIINDINEKKSNIRKALTHVDEKSSGLQLGYDKFKGLGYENVTDSQINHFFELGIDVTKLTPKTNAPVPDIDFQNDNYQPLIYMGKLKNPNESGLELSPEEQNVFMKKDGYFILNKVGSSPIPGTFHYNCKIIFKRDKNGYIEKKNKNIYFFEINTNTFPSWGGKKSSKTKKPVKKTTTKKPTTKKPVKKTNIKKPTTKKPVKKTTTKKPTTKKPVKKTTTKKSTTKKPVKKTTTKKQTTKKPVKKTTTKKPSTKK